jgi:DNA mismatch repair protein PMS2
VLVDVHVNSEVRLRDHGLDGIEVIDDGTGIDEDDFESIGIECWPHSACAAFTFIYIALKHCTSKLRSFEDISQVRTLGFRGEALSALANLSKLSVVTATGSSAPKGVKLTFDYHGKCISKTVVARDVRCAFLLVSNL